jgi:hypothetical protein
VFAALLISYLELFGVPTKTKYVEHVAGADLAEGQSTSTRPNSRGSRTLLSQSQERLGTAQNGECHALHRNLSVMLM